MWKPCEIAIDVLLVREKLLDRDKENLNLPGRGSAMQTSWISSSFTMIQDQESKTVTSNLQCRQWFSMTRIGLKADLP